MFKKLWLAPVASALTFGVLAAPPAAAAVTARVVQGHNLAAAGLQLWTSECGAPNADATRSPFLSVVNDAPPDWGTTSAAWQFTGAGDQAGPLGYVEDPTNLFWFDAYIRGPIADHMGQAVAFYTDSDGYTFVGQVWLNIIATSWRYFDISVVNLDWWMYDPAGDFVTTIPATTVSAIVGGDKGEGAYLGFNVGCNGQRYQIDGLQLGQSGNQTTYNFEGKQQLRSRTSSGAPRSARASKTKTSDSSYGQEAWALGHSHGYDGQSPLWYNGNGTLQYRPAGTSTWRRYGSQVFQQDNYSGYRIAPQTKTQYRFLSGGNDVMSPSTSEIMTVSVKARVSGKVADRSVVAGRQKVTVKGKVKPGLKGTKILLQRKKGGWKTIAKGKTRSGGKYTLKAPARQTGLWKVRVKVPTNKKNLADQTGRMKLVVKKPFVPKNSGPRTPTVQQGTYTPPSAPTLVQAEPDPTGEGGHHRQRAASSPDPIRSTEHTGPKSTLRGERCRRNAGRSEGGAEGTRRPADTHSPATPPRPDRPPPSYLGKEGTNNNAVDRCHWVTPIDGVEAKVTSR